MRFRLQGFVVGAQAQIFGWQVGVDNFVGIQLVVGIPDRLEFTEGVHELGPEHFWKQGSARLPVAVLAGERASVADDQVGCPFNKLAVFADAGFALEIEAYAHVDAPMPEVAIEGAGIAVFVHQGTDIAQIAAELFRSYCRVVPPFPLRRRSRREGGCPWPGLP